MINIPKAIIKDITSYVLIGTTPFLCETKQFHILGGHPPLRILIIHSSDMYTITHKFYYNCGIYYTQYGNISKM